MPDAVQARYTALPLRDHTILGVCEAIGEDFGFNPTFLRVPLAAGVLFSIECAIAAYLLLGVVVLASRLIFPHPRVQSATSEVSQSEPTENPEHAGTREHLPLAA